MTEEEGNELYLYSRAKSYGTLALKLGGILESSGGFKKY